MLDELFSNIENIEKGIIASFRNKKLEFNKDAMVFLKNFGDEIEKAKELALKISNESYSRFDGSILSSTILIKLRDLYVLLAPLTEDEENMTFRENNNLVNVNVLQSVLEKIIDFKPALKKLKRQYEEYVEIENSNSIFDETKIDKEQILTYINQSLQGLMEETTIPEKEKEKLIIIYKEDIKYKHISSSTFKMITTLLESLKEIYTKSLSDSPKRQRPINKAKMCKSVKYSYNKIANIDKYCTPTQTVGKKKMFVFDEKKKTLFCFISSTGFTYSGTTLKGFTDKSFCIKIKDINLLSNSISSLNTYCTENEEKKKEVTTGRFNENMLILAVS